VKKILSLSNELIYTKEEDLNELLGEIISTLQESFLINNIPVSSAIGKELTDTIFKLSKVKEIISTRSKTSSLSSIESLGDQIASYDKEFLYTYKWGVSEWSNIQEKKADFQKWLEGGYKLPQKGATLNCWEATIVNLYLYNAFDKNDLVSDFNIGKEYRDENGTIKCIECDSDIISSFLGFFGPKYKVDSLDDIKPGDIISFTSINGTENAHVAVTFESGDTAKLGSFWTIPREKMILISPSKLLTVCSEAIEKSTKLENLDINQIKISNKFRHFFQSLVD
jgi:hypothetical protein